jgi:hypothetical protein
MLSFWTASPILKAKAIVPDAWAIAAKTVSIGVISSGCRCAPNHWFPRAETGFERISSGPPYGKSFAREFTGKAGA